MTGVVVADLGRAGLGNLLFPWLRSAEISYQSGRTLLPPRWMQLRLGPYIRREADRREYFRLFPRPPFDIARARNRAIAGARADPEPADWRHFAGEVLVTRGMRDHFHSFELPWDWHRAFLLDAVRPGVVSPGIRTSYLAMHIRLGDFRPPESGVQRLAADNTSTSISWFLEQLRSIRASFPDLRCVVASDGSDDQLAPILEEPNVDRSPGRNAIDDLLVLASSAGLVGSRSTFSAWGAFLGDAPMLVQEGGNRYTPNEKVFETSNRAPEEFLRLVRQRVER